MPVEVSYLKSNSTDNGTGWTNHTHSLSVEDHTVPTAREFRALENKVDKCLEAVEAAVESVSEIRECVDDCRTKVMNAKRSADAAAKRISDFATALTDTGKLATIFKKIVETNLVKIQHENDVMARAVKRLMELGIIKPEDRVVVEKSDSESEPITRRKLRVRAKGAKKTKTSGATISRKSTKN